MFNLERADPFLGLLMLIAACAYRVLGEWLGGATLGKMRFGRRVGQLNGLPCGLGAAVLRTVLLPIDRFFFGLPARLSMHDSTVRRSSQHRRARFRPMLQWGSSPSWRSVGYRTKVRTDPLSRSGMPPPRITDLTDLPSSRRPRHIRLYEQEFPRGTDAYG
jgi:hypothetical protein